MHCSSVDGNFPPRNAHLLGCLVLVAPLPLLAGGRRAGCHQVPVERSTIYLLQLLRWLLTCPIHGDAVCEAQWAWPHHTDSRLGIHPRCCSGCCLLQAENSRNRGMNCTLRSSQEGSSHVASVLRSYRDEGAHHASTEGQHPAGKDPRDFGCGMQAPQQVDNSFLQQHCNTGVLAHGTSYCIPSLSTAEAMTTCPSHGKRAMQGPTSGFV